MTLNKDKRMKITYSPELSWWILKAFKDKLPTKECVFCGTKITKNNLAGVIPYGTGYLCKNIICLIKYSEQKQNET
jgi:predicted nucleic acid binding AN1-type Zn finger protein